MDRVVKLFDLRQKVAELVAQLEQFDCEPALPLFAEVLSEASDRVRSQGGQFIFVYLPSWERLGVMANRQNLHCRDDVLSLVEALEVPLIDFYEVVSAHPDPLSLFPWRVNGHYTAEGYQLLAQQIEAYLESSSAE